MSSDGINAARRQRLSSWPLRDDIHMYDAPQPRRHANGVEPVCRRMCACIFHFFEKGLRQPGTAHTKIFGRAAALVVVGAVVDDVGVVGADEVREEVEEEAEERDRERAEEGLFGLRMDAAGDREGMANDDERYDEVADVSDRFIVSNMDRKVGLNWVSNGGYNRLTNEGMHRFM